MQSSVKIAVLAACLMLAACVVNASSPPLINKQQPKPKKTKGEKPLRKDQVDICDHRCSGCGDAQQRQLDERVNATPVIRFCKTCKRKPGANFTPIGSFKKYDEKYEPNVTSETSCYGPTFTRGGERNSGQPPSYIGILGTTKGDGKDTHIKVVYKGAKTIKQ